jgi:hypothetical protein
MNQRTIGRRRRSPLSHRRNRSPRHYSALSTCRTASWPSHQRRSFRRASWSILVSPRSESFGGEARRTATGKRCSAAKIMSLGVPGPPETRAWPVGGSQRICRTALPVNSRSISRRATVPISLHGASTAICGRNLFAAIRSASKARPMPARSTLINSWNSVSP